MDHSILDTVGDLIETEPQSGQALLLFGLVSTLATAKTGHVYLLNKLVQMQPATRQLAYALMEYMAQGGTQSEAWQTACERINRAFTNS